MTFEELKAELKKRANEASEKYELAINEAYVEDRCYLEGFRDSLHEAVKLVLITDPVKRGKWKKQWHSGFHRELPACSECGQFVAFRTFYCPNCGAKMDEGAHES